MREHSELEAHTADALVARTLLPVTAGLTCLFGFFIAVDLFVRPPEIGLALLPVDLVSIAAFAALALLHWRRPPPDFWSQRTLALVMIGVLVTIVHLFFVDPQPVHTIYLILVVIAAGSLFLSWPWFATSVALTLSAWAVGAMAAGAGPSWMDFGFGLVAAVGLGAMVQGSRQRTYARLHVLHQEEVEARAHLERSLAQARLNEDRFQLLASATQDVAWDWDVRGGKLWWNENFYRIFGHARASHVVTARFWTDCVHPNDRRRVATMIRDALEGRASSWSHEYRLRRADGTFCHVLDRACVLSDASGVTRIVGSLTDVTAHREAEAASRGQSELYQRILDALGEAGHAVALLENAGMTYANEPARRLLQIGPGGTCGPLVATALTALTREGGRRADIDVRDPPGVQLSAYALDRADVRRVLLVGRRAKADADEEAPDANEERPREGIAEARE